MGDLPHRASPGVSGRRVLLAWGVHLLTASGAVVGAAALAAVAGGAFSAAALWMLVALAIDSVDGSLARAVGVKRAVPRIDGRRLDDVVDFLNYAIVPAVFMLAAGNLLAPGWIAVPILASAYQFSQVEAKTEDDYFLGFPSYWNVVAIYLWLLGIGPALGTAIVGLFAVLAFVPLKYLYPSHMGVGRRAMAVASVIWIIALAVACAWPEPATRWRLAEITLALPAGYLAASFWLGGLHRA
jgi:phosphatidylcholine synthase